MQSISILGCGWLGLETAKFFIEQGIQVKGSTTSKEKIEILKREGVQPYHLNLNEETITNFSNHSKDYFTDFFETDICLINIPPPKENKEFYKTQMEFIQNHLLQNKKTTKKVIFISSTSIYKDYNPKLNKEVVEADVQTVEEANRKDIFEAENVFVQTTHNSNLEVIILRAGGLMGGTRVAGKYFASKKDLITGAIPVNFIHRKDLIHIISLTSQTIYQNKLFKDKKIDKYEAFNVVCPIHPTRQEVYQKNAKDYNFEAPTFKENALVPNYKIVRADKLKNKLGYRFIHPDPLFFPIEE